MACYDNIISVRNSCTSSTPTSGFYIDEINIDLPFLNDVVTKSYSSGEDLFNKKVAFAWQIMASQVRNHFSDRYKTSSVIDQSRIGFIQSNKSLKSGSAQYRGIDFELCNTKTYLDLYVSKIEFFSNYTGDLDILVFDIDQGLQIDTIELTGIVAGEIYSLALNRTYKSEQKKLHLAFLYDATGVNSYNVTIGESGCTTCGRNGYYKSNKFAEIRSISMGLSDDPISSNIDGLNHTGGLSLIYSLGCNNADWICDKLGFFGLAMLYKTGAEILTHTLTNWDQINSSVLVHRDKIKERRDELESLFIEELNGVLRKVRVPNDNICFKCNPKSVTRTILP